MTVGTLDEFLAVARGPSANKAMPADAGNPDAPFAGMFRGMFASMLTTTPDDIAQVVITRNRHRSQFAVPGSHNRQCPSVRRGKK